MAAKKRKSTAEKPRNFAAMNAAIAFQAGKSDYRHFRPRPPTPTNENCDEPEAMRFYGWMMSRADDVMKIIEDLRTLDISEKKHNALMDKRVAALDRAHAPDGRNQPPLW